MPQSKYWIFTVNNPEIRGQEFVDKFGTFDFLVYQLEKGENETVHYQGYICFPVRKTLAGVKRLHPRAHWEVRRGTHQEAKDYCMKDDTREDGPFLYGDDSSVPGKRGQRSDLKAFVAEVKSGRNTRQLLETHAGVIARYPRFYQTVQNAYHIERNFEKKVVLHIGATGLGKTRAVYDLYADKPEFYRLPLQSKQLWLDGYDGQQLVLFDDFAGKASHMPLVSLLQLLDRYTVKTPIKGGYVNFAPNTIIITSNIHPWLWYDWEKRIGQYDALARRFWKVVVYYEEGTSCSVDKTVFFDMGKSYTDWESFLDSFKRYGPTPEID